MLRLDDRLIQAQIESNRQYIAAANVKIKNQTKQVERYTALEQKSMGTPLELEKSEIALAEARQDLAKAAAARSARAQIRAELKSGLVSVAELLDRARTDEQLAAMRVTALLAAMPGYGKVRAAALLAELRIAESRRLRGLGPNQRAALLERIQQAAQSRS